MVSASTARWRCIRRLFERIGWLHLTVPYGIHVLQKALQRRWQMVLVMMQGLLRVERRRHGLQRAQHAEALLKSYLLRVLLLRDRLVLHVLLVLLLAKAALFRLPVQLLPLRLQHRLLHLQLLL
jgi:hypothetical protein